MRLRVHPTPSGPPVRASLASWLTAAALLAWILAQGEAEAGEYSLGHGDLRIHFTGTQLYQTIHLDSESIMDGVEAGNPPFGVEYFPSEVSILVPEPTVPRPSGAEWAFIGNSPGDPVWFIPEVQEFDRPWLGLSSETLLSSEWTSLQLSLTGMSGPPGGHFSLSDSGGDFFGRTFFATSDGITAADTFSPVLQSHAHFSWLFTQPGDYDITLQVAGDHVNAGEIFSAATFHFAVVPEPGAAGLCLMAGIVTLLRCRLRMGSSPRSLTYRKTAAVALFLTAICLPLHAQTPGKEQQWKALSDAVRHLESAGKDGSSDSAMKDAKAAVSQAAADFILAHPDDSRVKEATQRFWETLRDIPPSAETAAALLKTKPDAARDLKESLELIALAPRRSEIAKRAATDPAGAAQAERELIAEYMAKYPGGRTGFVLVSGHFNSVDRYGAVELARTARELADSKAEEISDLASRWLKTEELKQTPLDLSFTAIDGREVDFAKLRGKVALLEFTGITWCPACRKSEIVLKGLYEKYHSKGLEIVAITFEFDPAARDQVAKLIADRKLPWPFFFDGLQHESPHVKRFGINAFPTVFLFDRTGRLHASHLKDEALEPMIGQLLGTQVSAQPSRKSPNR